MGLGARDTHDGEHSLWCHHPIRHGVLPHGAVGVSLFPAYVLRSGSNVGRSEAAVMGDGAGGVVVKTMLYDAT